MTSKNLFFKRLKQDIEQRIWLPVVFFIMGFLFMELVLLSEINTRSGREYFLTRMNDYLLNGMFTPACGFLFLTVCMAVLSALSGFSYMHSSKKLDVYHCIPIKRETLFVQQYIYGVIYFVIPMVIHVAITLLICGTNGLLSGAVFQQAMWFIFVQTLMYLVIYSLVVLVVCLTGNLVISVLGIGVLCAYSLILSGLKYTLMNRFFMTYYTTDNYEIPAFSPAHLIYNMIWAMNDGETDYLVYSGYAGYYVKLFLMAAVFTGIALFLYKKRPTEVAGKSLAFPITEPVIKTMIVFPVSVYAGELFTSIFSGSDFLWFAFGCGFGFIICCPLMEVIYRKDVKAVITHPLQIVFNGVLLVGVIIIFKFDVFGYDTYVPKEEKVESYTVMVNEMPYIQISYGGYREFALNNMEITDNESVRKLAEHGVEITRPVRTDKMVPAEGESHHYSSMSIRYNLKNGKSVYRDYLIDMKNADVMQWLSDMYADIEYKQGIYPILNDEGDKNYAQLRMTYGFSAQRISLDNNKMQTFLDTYRKELEALTFEEIQQEYPLAIMDLAVGYMEDDAYQNQAYAVTERVYIDNVTGENIQEYDYYTEDSGYKIYPSFTETIALLEEYGAEFVNEIQAEDVITIYIKDYSREVGDSDGLLTKQVELDYTAKDEEFAEIAEILPNLISTQMVDYIGEMNKEEEFINVRVHYYYDGLELSESCYFKKGMVPAFVTEDVEEAIANQEVE